MAVHGRTIGKRLCEAWGLDPDKVAAIHIDIPAGDIATARVEMYVDGEMVEQLYELHLGEVA